MERNVDHPVPAEPKLYTREFFTVFAAVLLFMTHAALQFQFAQYASFRGIELSMIGVIATIGAAGTLASRFVSGAAIDAVGLKPIWLVGGIAAAGILALMSVADSFVPIAVLRMAWSIVVGGVMLTFPVFASRIAPPHRSAEAIGTLGISGFIGMIIGPTLGDWIFSEGTASTGVYYGFFAASATLAVIAGVVMQFVNSEHLHKAPRRPRSADDHCGCDPDLGWFGTIRCHWPGSVLLLACTFSMAFCMQMIFLERFAESRGFDVIAPFFWAYVPTAVLIRVFARDVPQRFGRERVLIVGVTSSAVGLLLLTQVHNMWVLMLPAVAMGLGHGLSFPCMTDLIGSRFPVHRRALGMALFFAAGDVGFIVGFASLGAIADAFGFTAMLIALSSVLLVSVAVYVPLQWPQIARSPAESRAALIAAGAGPAEHARQTEAQAESA